MNEKKDHANVRKRVEDVRRFKVSNLHGGSSKRHAHSHTYPPPPPLQTPPRSVILSMMGETC